MEKLSIFIDETGIDEKSTIALLTFIVTDKPEIIRQSIGSIMHTINTDPEMRRYIPTLKDDLEYFHFTEDHQEVKNYFINDIPNLDFNAYITFVRKNELGGRALDEKTLIPILLNNVLRNILLKYHYSEIQIIYEGFGSPRSKNEQWLKDYVITLAKNLQESFRKVPSNISFEFQGKNELCLSVADYICGITQRFINLKISNGSRASDTLILREYYRVSGKIRLIHDLTRCEFYKRNKLFDIDLS